MICMLLLHAKLLGVGSQGDLRENSIMFVDETKCLWHQQAHMELLGPMLKPLAILDTSRLGLATDS